MTIDPLSPVTNYYIEPHPVNEPAHIKQVLAEGESRETENLDFAKYKMPSPSLGLGNNFDIVA